MANDDNKCDKCGNGSNNCCDCSCLSGAWPANVKRTYDEFQELSLESTRRNRSYIDKTLARQVRDLQETVNLAEAGIAAVVHRREAGLSTKERPSASAVGAQGPGGGFASVTF